MKQLLDRLIPFDDDHMVIREKKIQSIEVIENNLMTFRVPCKQACSPVKFTVTFNELKQLSPDTNEQPPANSAPVPLSKPSNNILTAEGNNPNNSKTAADAKHILKDVRIYVS